MSFLGGLGAAASGIGSLVSLFGGGNNQPTPPPPVYMPQNLSGADQGAYGAIGQLPQYNSAGQTLGQYGQVTQNLVNNPYAQGYQASANAIAPYATAAGGNILGSAQSFLPYAQQTLQTGFDPQNALYSQLFQQNTDQSRAAEAARGIAMTPYGAGVENQNNLNFNLAWQNQQLARQAQAASTAGSLLNNAGTGTTTGLNTLQQGAQLPYATANTIGGNQQTSLNNYGAYGSTATNTALPQIQAYLQYLGLGNQAAGVQNQQYANALTAQQQQFNQQQTLGKNLGSSLSGLGTYFGGGGASYLPYGSAIPGATGLTSVGGAPLQ